MVKVHLLDHKPYVGVAGEVHGELDVPHRCRFDYVGREPVECACVVRVGCW